MSQREYLVGVGGKAVISTVTRPAAAAANNGLFYVDPATGQTSYSNGSTWLPLAVTSSTISKTVRLPMSFTMPDAQPVALTGTPYRLGLTRLVVPAGQTVTLQQAYCTLISAGTVNFKVQKNDADISGWGTTASPLTITGPTSTTPSTSPVSFSSGDFLTVVILGGSGTPAGLSLILSFDHAV